MNASEFARAALEAKREVDEAFRVWDEAIHDDAIADDEARRAMAKATISTREQMPKATVGLVNAAVDLETADVQKAARLARGRERSAGKAVDAKRQWLSTLQSQASLSKAEAQLATWTPREVESA